MMQRMVKNLKAIFKGEELLFVMCLQYEALRLISQAQLISGHWTLLRRKSLLQWYNSSRECKKVVTDILGKIWGFCRFAKFKLKYTTYKTYIKSEVKVILFLWAKQEWKKKPNNKKQNKTKQNKKQ